MGDINLFVRSVFVFFIFVFLISSPVFAFYDDDSSFAGNVFLDSLVFSSSSTTVDLVLDDVVIGHELLWRASTTGTNYEESAVAYVDGVALLISVLVVLMVMVMICFLPLILLMVRSYGVSLLVRVMLAL
jgi:hypothetical protein